MKNLRTRTWAEIHLDRLEYNYHALRRLAPESRFTGLVKANAYGHGAVPVAKKLEELGADYLAVACLDEAVELRDGGIKTPIIILGNTDPVFTRELIERRLTQTVYDMALAEAFSARAQEMGKQLRCHLKVDTGMSRLGILWDGTACSIDTLEGMCRLPGLEWEGIFTHFADADSSPEYSRMQVDGFYAVIGRLAQRGITFSIRHCCNGAATILRPQDHLDMVRPGIPLYGLHPDDATVGRIELRPVMELKTHIASVKKLPKGTCVSYGRTHTLERDSVVAVVPVGYADGLPRSMSGRIEMLVHGIRVPQIGRICMDMCMLDVTDVPDAVIGGTVTIFGDGVPLQAMAEAAGTIPYELMCAVAPRVPRIYLN